MSQGNRRIVFSPDQYQLLDFGRGRKLERFGARILNRPAPVATHVTPSDPNLWKTANAYFQRNSAGSGRWLPGRDVSEKALAATWQICHDQVTLELKCTRSGAVGVYPEQAENWTWLTDRIRHANRQLKVLNLFAYTGGSTLTAAAAGAQVVHVDAARGVVSWARRCGSRSDLQDAPIRWITEDAVKFAQRELKRGGQYDGVILDPPTYGHGPKGQTWRIEKELGPLLEICGQLTAQQRAFVLLTCHASSWGPRELETLLADTMWGPRAPKMYTGKLTLGTDDTGRLPCGIVARWPA